MTKGRIKIFYLLSFLGGLFGNIIVPFFVVFVLSLGFNIVQVGFLFGASRLSAFIFEIPTGIFADSYGRKKSILLCYFLSIFSALIYFSSSNFYLLLVGSIIYGLALTFITGSFEALLVDSLELADKEHLRNKVFVRLGIITTLGFIVGGFVGSSVAYFNLRYVWLLQGAIAILALILGWKFLEEKFYPQKIFIKKKDYIKIIFNKIKNPLIFILRKKRISLMFFVAILMALVGAFYLIGWPIIFKDILSIPVHYFGIISGVAGAFFLIGSLIAERFSLKRGTSNTILSCLILMGVFYIVFALSKSIVLSLLSFVLIDFFNGGFTPLFYSLLNSFVPSSQRATILSFYSLTEGGSSGVGEIMAGKLLAFIAVPLVILLSPVLILIASIAFLSARVTRDNP